LDWFLHFAWLIPLGLAIGMYGTLIGAGGGFVLVPILLLLYPKEEPETIACISLAVVFFNAASGSWAYARMQRIDYGAAFVFTMASVPGAIVGAITTAVISRSLFDALLGVLMVALALYLLFQPRRKQEVEATASRTADPPPTKGVAPFRASRRYQYSVGSLLSLAVGYVSSTLGIGGGIVHVPVLERVLGFPVHVATATSHLVVATMALAGTMVHVVNGSFHHGMRRTIALAVGVIVGAPLGAWLSSRLRAEWIMRGLAVGLLLLGLRLFSMSTQP